MKRRDQRQADTGRGFGVIELVIAIGAIITIAALMVPVTNRARNLYHLTNAADEIISQLEYARSEAIKRDSTATVTFGTTGTYTVQYSNGTTVTTTCYLPPGVSLVVATGAAAPRVQFFSSGKTTVTPAGASIVLQNSAGTRTLTVSVAGNITRT
jgi:Tfp pilus assembly protein FimT